jgi:hypothetical protein
MRQSLVTDLSFLQCSLPTLDAAGYGRRPGLVSLRMGDAVNVVVLASVSSTAALDKG